MSTNPPTPAQRALNALAILASFAGRETIAHYLSMLAVIVEAASDDKPQLDELTKEIEGMVAAGRDPTAEEWQSMHDRRHQLEAQIAGIDSNG